METPTPTGPAPAQPTQPAQRPEPARPRLMPPCPPEAWVVAGLALSLAYYYLVPAPVLALPGLVLFAYLAWRRLDLALCLLPLTFPYWYVPKRVAGSVVFPLSEIALAVCAAVALAQLLRWLPGLRTPHARARLVLRLRLALARLGPWLALGAVLLALGAALGVLVAVRPREAVRAYRWEVAEPLLYLFLVLLVVHPRPAAISRRLSGERALLASSRLLIWSLLVSAVIVSLLAALQVGWLHVTFTPLAQGNRLIPYQVAAGAIPRATAFIYGSGNSLGAWLARALPLALALALCRGVPQRERWLAGAVFLCCLPALVWSASRGAQIAAAVACAIVACVALRRLWLAGAAAVLAALLALSQRNELAKLLLLGHGGTGEVRLLVWLAALRMLRDHPLLGIGPDQFLYYYDPAYTSHPYLIRVFNGHATRAVLEPNLAQPHNLALDLWLSGGPLALGGFVLALGNFWLRCLRLWRGSMDASRGAPGWTSAVALGLAGSVLAGILHGMVDSAYFAPDLALAFWWAAAALVVLERIARHDPRRAVASN